MNMLYYVVCKMGTKERYNNLDGLRALSCLGIIAMHIKRNTAYKITGFLYETVVESWTNFVYLFLMISGFGMFCGYYEKIKNCKIDLDTFYLKRYKKILPFFSLLILIDVIVYHSFDHVIEGITELTLVYGLLPNNQPDVIGVCWTLGVIFLFYMLFPFFCFLCSTKRRAWFSFIISLVLNLFCSIYFFSEKFVIEDFAFRHNFLFCTPLFLIGGLIYLYRNTIKLIVRKLKYAVLLLCILLYIGFLITPSVFDSIELIAFKNLILFIPWLCYAISIDSKILNNKIMNFFSNISLEMYLAQMLVFRAIEKAKLIYVFGDGWGSFIAVFILTVIGLIIFIEIYKKVGRFFKLYIVERVTGDKNEKSLDSRRQ